MIKWFFLGLKVSLSLALVYYAFSRIDPSSAWKELTTLSPFVVAICAFFIFGQFALAAARCMILLAASGKKIRYAESLDTSMIGAFFSQTLISFVGGDAMRVWRLSRYGIDWKISTKAILLDRTFGFVGHILVIALGFPMMLSLIPNQGVHIAVGMLIAAGIFGCAALIFFRLLPESLSKWRPIRLIVQLSQLVNELVRNRGALAWLLAISIGVQILNIAAVYSLAQGIGAQVSILECFALVPPVLFLALMPISISGWGVRESALIAVFATLNVPAPQSLAISLSYGLCLILVSLPGGLMWLHARKSNT